MGCGLRLMRWPTELESRKLPPMINNFFTPLRYPGGKGKLAEFLKAIVVRNDLVGGAYVEPYAGGAAVAIELLLLDYVEEIHINDLNPGIYAFWKSVLDHTDELISLIKTTSVTMDEWYAQKAIHSSCSADVLQLGFSTFFLNRCNRSGIIKGGVIGGKAQEGKWKLDARFNKDNLVERIEQISRFKDQIFLYNSDAAQLVASLSTKLPKRTLYYLDPPYYVKGKGLYDNFYCHDDHASVASTMGSLDSSHWVVSYDDVEQIRSLYSNYRALSYRLSYSAQTREKGGEIMFFSPLMEIPDIPSNAPMHLAA